MVNKVVPFLWFDTQALEAAEFYVSLLPDSRLVDVSKDEDGNVRGVSFILKGTEFSALNGGPYFPQTPAFSLYVECEDQAEVDRLWSSLTLEGEESQCGWLKDKYGVSWQIIPKLLTDLLNDETLGEATMEAMLKMRKIESDLLPKRL